MTLDGTNTWLLREPGVGRPAVVIDPGPDDPSTCARSWRPRARVDRDPAHPRAPRPLRGRGRAARADRAPVRALDPAQRLGGEGLGDGDVVAAAGVELRVVATPGHTADSLCFAGRPTGGAHRRHRARPRHHRGRRTRTAGSATTSTRCAGCATSARRRACCPGTGRCCPTSPRSPRRYLAHREERLEQVRAALDQLGPDARGNGRGPGRYADVDPVLWPAAELSVRAQLEYLRR